MGDSEGKNRSSFDEAVSALLSPLHQATTKEEIAKAAQRRVKTVEDMRHYWRLIQGADWHKSLPSRIIHITGTKGKGSTACMCEAILRSHGYSTGLFTSPHLLDIRERIRWNGRPVHANIFSKVYWRLREKLEASTAEQTDIDCPPRLPGYFRMLTLMAVYAFCQLEVDVMILEVGMGGRYDATNFIHVGSSQLQQRYVCGVTLLDLDHTRILGNTLELIAWEKGGIFAVDKADKTNLTPRPTSQQGKGEDAPSRFGDDSFEDSRKNNGMSIFFILDSNTAGTVRVFRQCAHNEGRGGKLELVDATGTSLRKTLDGQSLGLAGEHQYGNATLAFRLCESVLDGTGRVIDMADESTIEALTSVVWPGRCQTENWAPSRSSPSSFTFHLDGAHTPQSLKSTVQWFKSKLQAQATTQCMEGGTEDERHSPVLVFGCSHERDPVELLRLLTSVHFSHVYFAKPDSSRPSPVKLRSDVELLEADNNIEVIPELLARSQTGADATWQETCASIWRHLTYSKVSAASDQISPRSIDKLRYNLTVGEVLNELVKYDNIQNDSSNTTKNVLVVGSLYLVGSFLNAMEWKEDSSPDCEQNLASA